MKMRASLLAVWLAGPSFATADGGDAVEPYLLPKDLSAHRSITATVERVVSDMVRLRTEERTIRYVALSDVKRDRMSSPQPAMRWT